MRVPPGYTIARPARRFTPRQVDALTVLFNCIFNAGRSSQAAFALVH